MRGCRFPDTACVSRLPLASPLPPPPQLQVSVDQKHLAEARSGILSILHTIMASVTLLWSVLFQADSSDRPAAACAASTSNINLGSTKVTVTTPPSVELTAATPLARSLPQPLLTSYDRMS